MEEKEIKCHIFRIRIKGDYYNITVCGSKYNAEQYMKKELHATEIQWIKSYVTTKDFAIKVGKKNKTIARNSFLLRMEFAYALATKRTKPLIDKNKQKEDGEDNGRTECKSVSVAML